ncbi:MAG TPA: HD domain-containing protein [Leptolyngbyaceae cyanobacterium]
MTKFTPHPILSSRFSDALVFANQVHVGQIYPGSDIPYISHLLAAASFVLQAGGAEDEAIAALLLDCYQDMGIDLDLINERFGWAVKGIIKQLTKYQSLPLSERLSRFAESIFYISDSAVRVSIAHELQHLRLYSEYPDLFNSQLRSFYTTLILNYERRRISPSQVMEMRLLLKNLP